MAKKKPGEKPVAVDPSSITAHTTQEYANRGWLFYTQKNYPKAVDDFMAAKKQSPDNPDVLYALGLALAAGGQSQAALVAFEDCLSVLESIEDLSRKMMLRKLTKGHINRIKTGDWSLPTSR